MRGESSIAAGGDISNAQLVQAIMAAANANQTQQPAPSQMTQAQAMNEFCKRRPPSFHGDPEPILAKAWLKGMKVILNTLDIIQDRDRVALATYQLKGEACY